MVSVKDYIKQKLKILKQLGIAVTNEEKDRLMQCKTEYEADRYARDLIIGPEHTPVAPPVRNYEPKRDIFDTSIQAYNIKEVEQILGVSYSIVRRLIESGKLVCINPQSKFKKGGRLVSADSIIEFLKQNPKYRARANASEYMDLKGEK